MNETHIEWKKKLYTTYKRAEILVDKLPDVSFMSFPLVPAVPLDRPTHVSASHFDASETD